MSTETKPSFVDNVKNTVSKVRTYWKTPPVGKYMTMKEIVSLAGGGAGVKFIITCVQGVMLAVDNIHGHRFDTNGITDKYVTYSKHNTLHTGDDEFNTSTAARQ